MHPQHGGVFSSNMRGKTPIKRIFEREFLRRLKNDDVTACITVHSGTVNISKCLLKMIRRENHSGTDTFTYTISFHYVHIVFIESIIHCIRVCAFYGSNITLFDSDSLSIPH